MDAIQSLATQVMREFLKHCEISDHSLEPLNQCILDISTVGEQDESRKIVTICLDKMLTLLSL